MSSDYVALQVPNELSWTYNMNTTLAEFLNDINFNVTRFFPENIARNYLNYEDLVLIMNFAINAPHYRPGQNPATLNAVGLANNTKTLSQILLLAAPPTKLYLGENVTIDKDVVDLGGSKVKNAAEPVDAQDLTTKHYVDAKLVEQAATIGNLQNDLTNLTTKVQDILNFFTGSSDLSQTLSR
jgi:hypothetical protein